MYCGGVDYLWIIVMFLSAVWTHSDGTHSQQSKFIHWWASQVELYCHSVTCGYIQWNETLCLTGPRRNINTDIQQWSKKEHYKHIHKLTYWQILTINILYINKKIQKLYKLYECFKLILYMCREKHCESIGGLEEKASDEMVHFSRFVRMKKQQFYIFAWIIPLRWFWGCQLMAYTTCLFIVSISHLHLCI